MLLAPLGLIVAMRRRKLREPWLVLAAVVTAQWIVISVFPRWWGGWSYGPRFFTDCIPFLLVLAVPVVASVLDSPQLLRRVGALSATGALVAAGVIVNAEGALTRSSFCWNIADGGIDVHPARLWDWSDPQLLAGLRGIEHNGIRYELARGDAIGNDATPEDGGIGGCRFT